MVCMRVSFMVRVSVRVIQVAIGSFHVKSTDGFHSPPPILLKFGTLVGFV